MRRLIEFEWLIVAALLPFAIFPTPERAAVLLLIPLLWLVRRRIEGHFVPRTPLDLPLLLLLLMVLVSLFVTPDLAFSLPKITGLVHSVALFYAVVAAAGRTDRVLWWGVLALLLCGLAVAGLGLLGMQTGLKLPVLAALLDRLPAFDLALPGTAGGISGNEVAGVLLWSLPLALTLPFVALRRNRPRTGRDLIILLVLLAAAAIIGGVFLLTQSRAGYLGLGAALLFMGLLWFGRYSRPAGALLLLLLGGLATLLLLRPQLLPTTLSAPAEQPTVGNALSAVTLESRQQIWRVSLYAIGDFPLTGTGMNIFRRLVPLVYPLWPEEAAGLDVAHAHNHLLQAALDLGLPGLVAYLALWLGAAHLLWQSWLAGSQRALIAAFAAALLAYFVYGIFDAVALGARPGFIFWLLLGLVVAQHRLVRKRLRD